MRPRSSLMRLLLLGLVLGLVASVAACSSGGGKSLTDKFQDQITKSDFQASGRVTGSGDFGTEALKMTATIDGTFKAKGKDSATSMTMKIVFSGQTTTTSQDQIVVGDSQYQRSDNGSWTKTPRKDSSDVGSLFRGKSGFDDKGVETKDGKQLHKLVLKSGESVDASFFGTSDTMKNLTGKVWFWAKDDGTPAGVTVDMTWNQDAGGQNMNAHMVMDMLFDKLDGVTIEAPAGV